MDLPHSRALLAALHDEDLFRIRYRLRKILIKKGPDLEVEAWVGVLTRELDKREEEHRARIKAVRQA